MQNNGPARRGDIVLQMNEEPMGTRAAEVCKGEAQVVFMEGGLGSLARAVLWGRSVLENVRTAALFGKAQAPDMASADTAAWQVLEEVGLAPMALQPAHTLTLSGQKRLEIARAVATGAQLVLLDEVMAGLTPTEVAQMLQTLRALHATRGLTLLVIEHVMRALMELCEEIVVLHHGSLIAQGTPAHIAQDPQVHAAYFGDSP